MEIIRLVPFIGFVYFLALILCRIRQLKQKGIKPYAWQGGIKSHFNSALLVLFFLLYAMELFIQFGWIKYSLLPTALNSHIHSSFLLKLLGVILIILSVFALNFTLRAFRESLRFGLDSGSAGMLITSGIFAHSRNPFFVSIECLLSGIALVLPSPFFIAVAALSIVAIHFTILKEEKFLKSLYEKEYLDYCKKVRRYF